MPQFRKNPITNGWRIISTERSKRPADFRLKNSEVLSPSENCPFEPGNEEMTPGEIFSYVNPEGSGSKWWIRGFPAKSPVLRIEGEVKHFGLNIFDKVTGIGAHEIIVESPDHNDCFSKMDTNQIEKVFWAYRDRIIDLKRDKRFRYILIFKNHGPRAGSHIDHPHSQVIALPVTPKKIKEELEGARFHYSMKERCIFCDIIDQESKLKERVIMETKHFIALAPWAPRFPFETWILPKEHSHDFTALSKSQAMDLALLFKRFFRALIKILKSSVNYNLILHDTPNLIPQKGYWDSIEKDFHWHFEVIPRIKDIAGFEWGTGFYINSLPPEFAAEELRKVIYE